MSIWYYKEFEAERALKAAQAAIAEALTLCSRPHLLGTASFKLNLALRQLTTAQWRLMQAKSEYEAEHRKEQKK